MSGRRARAKAANRAALVQAALEAFGESGYDAVGVRDIVRRTDLASGTFYNHFPDKAAVFAAVVAEVTTRARARVRAARLQADDLETLAERGFRAYFEFIVEDPATCAFLRRNLAPAAEAALPLGIRELAEDLARVELPPADLDYAAHAMVAVGIELGARMVERDPPDVDGATRFAAALFSRGLRR